MLLHKTGGSVQEHAFLQLLGIPEGNMAMSQAVDRCFLKVEVYDRFSRSPTFWAKGFLFQNVSFVGFAIGDGHSLLRRKNGCSGGRVRTVLPHGRERSTAALQRTTAGGGPETFARGLGEAKAGKERRKKSNKNNK